MSNTKTVMSQAGNTQGIPPDITDVFSTYLYDGTSAAQTITNGIDLSGEGGLVWLKSRTESQNNYLFDTARGPNKFLMSDHTAGEQAVSNRGVTAFNSGGFDLGSSVGGNRTANNYASWTFRKAPKFFDVVTWTGNSTSGREIAHNLGSVPGMIIVKSLTEARQWMVYHRSTGKIETTILNSTVASANTALWNSTDPTSTVFTLNNDGDVNTTGNRYVAYLYAHNDGDGVFGPTGDQDIIKCGSYVGAGGGNNIEIGFEPQWLLIKNITQTAGWVLFDNMRGIVSGSGGTDARLYANATTSENTGVDYLELTPTGINLISSNGDTNASGQSYIYMAIRRGPLAPPTAGTEVFAPNFYGTSGYVGYLGAPADMSMLGYRSGNSQNAVIRTRMLSNTKGLVTSSTAAEVTTSSSWDNMSGVSTAGSTITTLISWTWKRAPSFFDAVAYTGTGSPLTLNHNLGVAPELVLYKSRSAAEYWFVQSSELTSVTDSYVFVNYDNAESSAIGTIWRTPDATTFGVDYTGNLTGCNTSGATYIAYLFATLAGVSKVGSVTHSGTTNVDCGFSAGARFVLLKRTDATGGWYVWDSVRGIVSGNDPYLLLNSTAAEVTNTDYIDPLSSGFTITSTLTAGDYIFYAIA